MNLHDLFRVGKSGLVNEDGYDNCPLERKQASAIGKAVALLLPLIVCSGSAGATIKNDGGFGRSPKGGWIRVSETESIATYMYPSTIHRQGSVAHMWSLINYKSPQTNSASSLPFLSEKSEGEYDCENAKWRIWSSALHTHKMGNGQTVFSTRESGQWQPVTPNSDSEILWKTACKKYVPKGMVP
jgi:hypothetical protein